jgi:hypothetical protein
MITCIANKFDINELQLGYSSPVLKFSFRFRHELRPLTYEVIDPMTHGRGLCLRDQSRIQHLTSEITNIFRNSGSNIHLRNRYSHVVAVINL